MLFSDEDLIAYLLGDASDELTQRLQQRLPIDEELLQRLTSLRLMLGQINSASCVFEPPADLVDTTLERIDQMLVQPSQPGHCSDAAAEPDGAPDVASNLTANLTPNMTGLARGRSLWDSTALTISLTLLSCLILPALLRVRFESRKAQCARNLELTGSELIGYALNHPQGRFPHVALDGPQAFAGVYAIYLREAGGQIPNSQLRCPSLPTSDTASGHNQFAAKAAAPDAAQDAARLPAAANIASFSELHSLAGEKLQLAQQAVGGDYAYNLGVSESGRPRAPKYAGRSQFAILADAPALRTGPRYAASVRAASLQTDALQTDASRPADDRLAEFVAHEGKGINIFYEDGHVQFVSVDSLRSLILSQADSLDNPFENQFGAHELGVHPYDASLAPSDFPPLSH